MEERNYFVRKLGSPQKVRKHGITKKKQNQDGKFDWKHKLKNLRKQVRMIKQKREAVICGNRKEKATREKIIQLEEINQKVLAKEGRLKISTKVKTIQTKQDFQNNERKFYQQLGGGDMKTYQQPDAKKTERFWTKIWQPKKHDERAEWINNITRELEGLEENPKVEMHIDLLKTTLKKYQTGKRQAMMEYMGSGSRNSPPFTAD